MQTPVSATAVKVSQSKPFSSSETELTKNKTTKAAFKDLFIFKNVRYNKFR